MAKKDSVKKITLKMLYPYLFVIISAILTTSIFLCGKYGWIKIPSSIMSKPDTTDLIIQNRSVESDIVPTQDSSFEYKKDPAYPDASFFEDLLEVNEQDCYIASSIVVDPKAPPSIIIYSHGSTISVKDKMEGNFMLDLREYAEYFTERDFIFAASNQHGDNWGEQLAITDTEMLYKYIIKTYKTNRKVYLIGYSMGGLVTMNYAIENPKNVDSIALLAPTSYSSIYTQDKVDLLKDIDIRIWHGNKDVNIDIEMSERLVNKFALLGRKLDLEVVDGATHWDVDTELIDDIWEFYQD